METIIKNIHLIGGMLPDAEQDKLEHGALQYRKFSRITFKILEVKESSIKIQTVQTKSPHENYLDEQGLINRTKELFIKFFPDRKIIVNATPYSETYVDRVSPEYIRHYMTQYNVKVKDIVAITGIDKTNVSAWVNGTREMSQPVKAMFYFYFQWKIEKQTTGDT